MTPAEAGSGVPDGPLAPRSVRALLDDPDALHLQFQPILDVRSSRTAGWEILTRFAGPRGRGRPTDEWFAAAYAAGLGVELERLVLSRSLPAVRLRSPGTFMTVNVTPAGLADPEIEDLIAAQAPLHGVVVELTEQLVPHVTPAWADACHRLRLLGARIAIDDLGTGYAELVQILAVRPDIIKLDRRVVATVDRDPAQRALVTFLGEFGDHLDAWLLAEGVERPAQLATLAGLGVPLAQGWLTGRPCEVPRPCPEEVLRACPPAAAHGTPPTIAQLVRPARVLPAGRPDRGPAPAAAREPRVALDVGGRPATVHLPQQDGEPDSTTASPLVVDPSLAPAEAARRAMARPAARRFDPLVAVDPTGAVLGVVTVTDLVLALADR